MHQTRRVATAGKHTRHQLFLADMALAHVLDLNTGRCAYLVRSFADSFPQRFGKSRVVKNSDSVRVQKNSSCPPRSTHQATWQ